MIKTENTSWRHKAFMLLLLSLIGGVLVFSVFEKRESRISKVVVQISKSKGEALIDKKEIVSRLSNYVGFDIATAKISELPINTFEDYLERDTRIGSCEVYLSVQNKMIIAIQPSEPIVRVVGTNGKGFYLDKDGNKINLSAKASVRVPVATGNIEKYSRNFLAKKEKSTLFQVWDISRRLFDDPQFLSPLIEQINVEQDKNIVLVPKLGREKIHFGQFENVDDKFYKLSEFYRDGLPKEGWNKYEVLRLDFKNQVVGQKKYN